MERNAAGTAVRFAKPRGIRELAFALPEGDALAVGPCARAAVEGAFVADFDPDRVDRKAKPRGRDDGDQRCGAGAEVVGRELHAREAGRFQRDARSGNADVRRIGTSRPP